FPTVVGLHDQEQYEGDDHEVDQGADESADRSVVGEGPDGVEIVDAGEDQSDQRIDDPFGEGGHHAGEGDAHHEGHRQLDDVALGDEFLELLDHGSSFVCRPTQRTTGWLQAIVVSWTSNDPYCDPSTSIWATWSR